MIRAYRYKLRPSRQQREAIDGMMEKTRWIYNHGLRERLTVFKQDGTHLTYFGQKVSSLTPLVASDESVRTVPHALRCGAYKRIAEAWTAFRGRWSKLNKGPDPCTPEDAGLPRYTRYGENRTLTYDAPMGSGWEYLPPVPNAGQNERRNAAFRLAPFGVIRTIKDRPVPLQAYNGEPTSYKFGGTDGYKMATVCEITRRPDGYYACVFVEDGKPLPEAIYADPLGPVKTRPKPGDAKTRVRLSEEERAERKAQYAAASARTAERVEALVSASLYLMPEARQCVAYWGSGATTGDAPVGGTSRQYTLPVPNASRTKVAKVPALCRQMARQRGRAKDSADKAVAAIERDLSLTEETRDDAIRRARRARSKRYRIVGRRKARIEQSEASARKTEHVHLAHRVLADLPLEVRRIVVCFPDVKPQVRNRSAIPDAESGAVHPVTGRVAGFRPNGQTRQTEKAYRILDFAPYAFFTTLHHEAAERGILVTRDKESTLSAPKKKKPGKKKAETA